MSRYLVNSLFLFIAFTVQAQQMKIEMIPLNNRTAEEMIDLIGPLVTEGGTVTGTNNRLIVKSTPGNLAEIKRLLQSLDKPLRRLMITVRQDVDQFDERDGYSVSGNYSSGDVGISNNAPSGRDGLEIAATDNEGNSVRYNTLNTRSHLQDNNDFRLQTVEGQAAFIDTGQSVPVANQTVYSDGRGIVVHDNVEYRDVTSGFYVLPRLNGDTVTLLVSPHLSRISPQHGGSFDIQNAETTVQGKLGQWIEIGGLNQHSGRDQSGILYSTNRRGRETRAMRIMVEEIPSIK